MPTISIITVTYNAASTIADCLLSVVSQTHPVEHIIVDGASTDTTMETVRRISPDVRILSEPDKGIYDAMNKGIGLATGEVVGILNADDFYSAPQVLEKVARVFEDPTVMGCYGDLEYISTGVAGAEVKEGKLTSHPAVDCKVIRYWKSGNYTSRSWYWGWMPPHPTFFVRRSVYERYGSFNLDLGSAADYELMLRLLCKEGIKTAYIPGVMVRMRVGGASNASLHNRLQANRMDRRAWEINGLTPYPWTLFCKPLRKLGQFFLRK